jgi:hypothetical protein
MTDNIRITPLGDGLTVISGLPDRPDLKIDHDFKIGERVRMKDHPHNIGTVASLPRGSVVQLGTHAIGNEMGVDLDAGGRAVANADRWERL